MAGAIEMSHLALIETLVKALQGVRHAPAPTVSLPRFFGRPESPGDPTMDEWLADFDVFVRQCGVPEAERAVALIDNLGGCARDEVLCHPDEVRRDFGALVSLLRRVFGPRETVTSLYAEFYSRVQSVGETLAEFSRALIRLHQRIEGAAPTVAERHALTVLGDGALKHQFVVGVRDEWVRHDLRRLMLRSADRPFIVVREEALCLMCEEEARVVQMRPVDKAAPTLSDSVGGSVSCVLGLDAIVLDDGGVSSGGVARYASVGDVSCGVDMELCVVDTMISGAVSVGLCDLDMLSGGGDTGVIGVDTLVAATVSGGLCDIDRVTGVGDTGVSGVDTLVSATVSGSLCDIDSVSGDVDTVLSGAVSSGLCDLDRVSRGDLVERVGDISLSRGGDAIMSGVDESVCCANSVLAAGILDSCGVEVVDGGVACDDGTRLPDAFRVGGCLSVVGPGVAPPGWVDGLFCADGSLRPEPPPMPAMCSHHRIV